MEQAVASADEVEGLARELGLRLYRTCVKENMNVAEVSGCLPTRRSHVGRTVAAGIGDSCVGAGSQRGASRSKHTGSWATAGRGAQAGLCGGPRVMLVQVGKGGRCKVATVERSDPFTWRPAGGRNDAAHR